MSEMLSTDDPPSLTEADRLAFRVDGVDYRWCHVFTHAQRRGDWRILETEVRQAEACLRLVAEEGPPLGRETERSVAVAFRRARRLHAAEDLEAWLEARELTVAQWRRYIRGEALRRHHAAELDTVVEHYPTEDGTIWDGLQVWGVCSGAFPDWAEQLATLVAAAHATLARTNEPLPGPDDLDALDVLFDRFADEVATRERLEALLTARYLDWLRLEAESAVFNDHDTAAEALLCVRDDGWSLSEATQAGRGRLRRHRLLVEETDPDTRHHFVRARDGDLLGPLPLGAEPTLVHVLRKDVPSLDDDDLRLRARHQLVVTAAAREVDDRVEWLQPARLAHQRQPITHQQQPVTDQHPGAEAVGSPPALRTVVDIVQWVALVAAAAFAVLLFVA